MIAPCALAASVAFIARPGVLDVAQSRRQNSIVMKFLVAGIISLSFIKPDKPSPLVNPPALCACEERNFGSQPLMERGGKTCRKKFSPGRSLFEPRPRRLE